MECILQLYGNDLSLLGNELLSIYFREFEHYKVDSYRYVEQMWTYVLGTVVGSFGIFINLVKCPPNKKSGKLCH